MKCINRLDIYVLGDRQHRLPKVAIDAERRLAEKPPTVILPDHTRKERGETRRFRNLPEPGPNVPQQIRMIMRNPQTQDVGCFEKIKIPVFKLEDRVKVEYPKDVQKYLSRDRRLRKIRPMDLHHRPSTVSIPSIDQWLAGEQR